MEDASSTAQTLHTRILPVDTCCLSGSEFPDPRTNTLDDWQLSVKEDSPDASHLADAVERLRTTDIPVAFPTETVYGLGADATRSAAVRGIYKAKQRPSDNPLIVHVCSLNQLRGLLEPKPPGLGQKPNGDDDTRSHQHAHGGHESRSHPPEDVLGGFSQDPIPAIYRPLIQELWPGPLTIILPNPSNSVLAPEVTGGRDTFGARMPDNALALALIKLAGVPLAAPSANASTKPSPTTAEHVQEDLEGRIEIILDGGPCAVGVESTVVDGLCSPPCVLRPGGVSMEQLRRFPGWEDVVVAYQDQGQLDGMPRAPGMKYRHYSPRAKVVLYECGAAAPSWRDLQLYEGDIGIIRTARWEIQDLSSLPAHGPETVNGTQSTSPKSTIHSSLSRIQITRRSSKHLDNAQTSASTQLHSQSPPITTIAHSPYILSISPSTTSDSNSNPNSALKVFDIHLGSSVKEIARGIFSALRELDRRGVSVILVEGIRDDTEEDLAAAVMNRLRKAATAIHKADENGEWGGGGGGGSGGGGGG